jgi:hypothetical protein
LGDHDKTLAVCTITPEKLNLFCIEVHGTPRKSNATSESETIANKVLGTPRKSNATGETKPIADRYSECRANPMPQANINQ